MRMLLLFFVVFNIYSSEDKLIFGVHPFRSNDTLISKFTPLLQHIEKIINKKIVLAISKDYKTHREKILNGKYDFAYIGPANFVKLIKKDFNNKVKIICGPVMNGKDTFTGSIIIKKHGKIKSINDLNNLRFGFSNPSSTMGYIYPSYVLKKNNIHLREKLFFKNHDNVALAVLMGSVDAGSVKTSVFQSFKDEGLVELFQTKHIQEHVFVSTHLSLASYKIIKKIFLNLKDRSILQSFNKKLDKFGEVKKSQFNYLKSVMEFL